MATRNIRSEELSCLEVSDNDLQEFIIISYNIYKKICHIHDTICSIWVYPCRFASLCIYPIAAGVHLISIWSELIMFEHLRELCETGASWMRCATTFEPQNWHEASKDYQSSMFLQSLSVVTPSLFSPETYRDPMIVLQLKSSKVLELGKDKHASNVVEKCFEVRRNSTKTSKTLKTSETCWCSLTLRGLNHWRTCTCPRKSSDVEWTFLRICDRVK